MYTIPTTTAEKQKEINKLSNLEKFCLNAYLTSEAPQTEKLINAYELSRTKESQANRQSIYMLARKWINSDKCKYYIEQRKKELFTHEPTRINGKQEQEGSHNDNDNNINRSKDDILTELNNLADNTNDPKLKAEILMKVADLEGMKKQEIKQEDKLIRYYLPLRCSNCELYKGAKTTKTIA